MYLVSWNGNTASIKTGFYGMTNSNDDDESTIIVEFWSIPNKEEIWASFSTKT